jgi:hypothetical protein
VWLVQMLCGPFHRIVATHMHLSADWLATIGYCSRRPIEKWTSHIFWLMLKLVFDIKNKFPFNLKITYQQFNAEGSPFDCYHF